ncbi:MAG TPA: double-strand break repair protein AddB [Rhizomicrobium sp.]|nr:double-strand break repair protein AddB [Rhizomicrobium sp.]
MAALYTIPAGKDFAGSLARGLLARFESARDPLALASVTIFLPTQRATRVLGDSFARLLNGAALLPQIRGLGTDDDEEFLFDPGTDGIDLPPAIDPVRRRLLLASLVRRWAQQQRAVSPGLARAAAMALPLSRFLDEVKTQQVDLAKLRDLAPEGLAGHWAEVCDFLLFLREQWPLILAAENALDTADRRDRLLRDTAQRYRATRPSTPVLAAGTTGSIPATAELLGVIAALPAGGIVLPALDRELDDESWNALEPGHPQFGMKQLLEQLGARRPDVQDWEELSTAPAARLLFLREALRPAPTTDAWCEIAKSRREALSDGLAGVAIVEAEHPGEEALAIALMLREAAESREKTAALVTPDRGLARRVAAELRRWDIAIDDSAGVPLAHTPPAVFLSLLAEAAAESFAPLPLLALLKHPFATNGEAPGEFRRRARQLDRMVLRGPRPNPGLGGIHKAVENARADKRDSKTAPMLSEIGDWFSTLGTTLQPFADAMGASSVSLAKLVELHCKTAEELANTAQVKGKHRLWRGHEGEAAAELMEALARAGEDFPDIEPAAYPLLLRQFANERAVRPAFGRHPRLAILGPWEARLQHFDIIILGGLNEGTWPQSTAADPWLSRPMRARLGLESPERSIGLAAHDFATLAAAKDVRLTRALKSDGVPTVASRWLQRLQQLAKGLGEQDRLLKAPPYAGYAKSYSAPDQEPKPVSPPAPRPPVPERPRELSVTQIEKWLRDPYAIYARYILKLKPLDPLDAEVGPMDRGRIMHEVLERFVRETELGWPANAEARLIAMAEEAFARYAIPQVALALWRPRFIRAARWFVAEERRRRAEISRSWLEIEGQIEIAGPAGPFVLKGRADRIDRLHEGGAAVVDYKTGKPPSDPQVAKFAPQLPLEGAILEQGGFGDIGSLPAAQLVYIRFSGGAIAGETHIVKGDAGERVTAALAGLTRRIAQFDLPDTPYTSRIAPYRADMPGDYDHLARVREWSLSGWAEE